jgi:hypothetical protein
MSASLLAGLPQRDKIENREISSRTIESSHPFFYFKFGQTAFSKE